MFQGIIDCDTHITEPADLWTSRVASKWADQVPHVAPNPKDEGNYHWFIGDDAVARAPAGAFAGWKGAFPGQPRSYEEAHPGSYDATARLEVMDEAGVAAQVLYPNVAGFASERFLKLEDEALKLACVQAYNDFQTEWVSVAPERYIPITAVPFWDVEATVAEIERGASMGHKGVLFTGEPQSLGQPFLGDRAWDPVWSTAQDLGLPVSFHIGSGRFDDGFTPERLAVDGRAATYSRISTSMFLTNGVQLSDLLLSGVLPRFPELKFISVESGIGWVPFMLEAVDWHFHASNMRKERPEYELLPSEYFRRQVFACYWFEQIAPKHQLEQIGVDNVLFETDFPHPTCLYGNVQEMAASGLAGQPEDVKRKILRENAAALYGVTVT